MMRALLQAAELLGFRGTVVPDVRDAGRRFAAVIQPDWEEVERRSSHGEGPIFESDALRALFELPEDEWVPWSSLDPIVSATLDTIPGAPLIGREDRVKRVWRPAVHVSGVIIREKRWARGLQRAAEFWVDAQRAYILPGERIPARAIRESEEYGVGVVAAPPGRPPSLILPPSTRIHGRGSPRHWRFLEAAFHAWTKLGSPREAQALR